MQKQVKTAAAVVALSLGLALSGGADAQQLNQRKDAAPQQSAKVSRLVSRASLQGGKSGDTLKRDDLSDMAVNTDCGPVQIGGTQTAEADPKPPSLIDKNAGTDDETTTIVRGSVVNICRR